MIYDQRFRFSPVLVLIYLILYFYPWILLPPPGRTEIRVIWS